MLDDAGPFLMTLGLFVLSHLHWKILPLFTQLNFLENLIKADIGQERKVANITNLGKSRRNFENVLIWGARGNLFSRKKPEIKNMATPFL
jgi:hypothetical protein